MESSDARYRLKLAEGFLAEARAQAEHRLYRAAVDAAQLSIENSIKAVVALFRPVPKVHELVETIDGLLAGTDFSADEREQLGRLQDVAEVMGFETHIRTDYGDELQGITPWELYDDTEAAQALGYAEQARQIALSIVEGRLTH